MEITLDTSINKWRVVNIISWILLGVWIFAALPMISLRFGGFGGNVCRYVYIGSRLYGLELYRHLILTDLMVDTYVKGTIVSALPAAALQLMEIVSSRYAKKRVRGF